MMRRAMQAAALALPLVVLASARAEDLPPAALRLQERLQGLRGIRMTFHQIRSVDLTGEEVEGAGLLAFRPPDAFRLAYTAPEPQEVVVRGDSLWVLLPEENQALRYAFSPEAPGSEIFLLFGGGNRALDDVFQVRQEPWADYPDALRLEPRHADPGYPMEDIRLVVGEDGYPRRLFFREITGDTVVFTFLDVIRDPPDIEELIRLRIPAGMEVLDGEELQHTR